MAFELKGFCFSTRGGVSAWARTLKEGTRRTQKITIAMNWSNFLENGVHKKSKDKVLGNRYARPNHDLQVLGKRLQNDK